MPRSYRDSHGGTLTEFVEKNPQAVLLFDEIEKAHAKTIQLFLQVLDAGTLEDKHHERNVLFRDTTVIFTTNVGKKLYDRPNMSGVHCANAAFHRRTILDVLENEVNPQTGVPYFPAAICSRMATGYPLLFNHLGVNELERVAKAELSRMAELLERQYHKQVVFDDALALCLVLREGTDVDARTLRSQTESFVKTEIFKLLQLFETNRLEEAVHGVDRICFGLDANWREAEPSVKEVFEKTGLPKVLLVVASGLATLYQSNLPQIEWRTAVHSADALEILADQEIDLVLVDIWIGRQRSVPSVTLQHFDHAPAAARGLDRGQELLRKIRERLPNMPVYLLSLVPPQDGAENRGSIDEELFMACVQAGGARGMIESGFVECAQAGWQSRRDQFAKQLDECIRHLHREKAAERMGMERKVITFDVVPVFDREDREIVMRLRNIRMARALAAADAGEVLADVERPRTKFDDVLGADVAKNELKFFIEYLRNPRRFAALGLKPPKGILLYGPPGTGKTMLARAMAGESDVAFLAAAASNFVTMWQGSGPQNVKELFARARRVCAGHRVH